MQIELDQYRLMFEQQQHQWLGQSIHELKHLKRPIESAKIGFRNV